MTDKRNEQEETSMSDKLNDGLSLRTAFVHPDLGIGGAERLIVDLAYGMKCKGHTIDVYTSHYNPQHCFEETKQLNIAVYGDFIPRDIAGAGYLLFAFLRGVYLALRLLAARKHYDVIVVDQLSLTIPILRFTGAKIVFYCHFPDQLLAKPGGRMKRLYRLFFDKLEEYTIRMADEVLVNSYFTKSVFHSTFKSIKNSPEVLYPAIKVDSYSTSIYAKKTDEYLKFFGPQPKLFVSINRFEMKKRVDLAVRAFASFLKKSHNHEYILVVAGGYDIRVAENINCLKELQEECEKHSLPYVIVDSDKFPDTLTKDVKVVFIRNFNTPLRNFLLHNGTALLYTPVGEHFGIVPVEAMYCELPVISTNTGGPRETVVNSVTGYLCEQESDAFADCMVRAIENKKALGAAGKLRVEQHFTADKQIEQFISQLVASLGLVHYDALTLWGSFIAVQTVLTMGSAFLLSKLFKGYA